MKKVVLLSALLVSVFLFSGCQKNFGEESGVQDVHDDLKEAVGLEEGVDVDALSNEELLHELESMDDVFVDDVSEIDLEL